MRIIPKRTKVRMELFQGVELMDVLIGSIGVGICAALLVSNLPGKWFMLIAVLVIVAALIVPIDDDKGYLLLYNVIRYFARYRRFYKKGHSPQELKAKSAPDSGKAKKFRKTPAPLFSVEDITPFTAIEGSFICYGDSYSATVLRIEPVEFRFFSESRQNSTIDRCLGAILRTCTQEEVINMVKLDQPILYDDLSRMSS